MSNKWETLRDKANSEFKKNNLQAAISLYTEAIKLEPNQDVLFSNRGLCHLNLGKYQGAINDLNKAISINPRNIKALKRLSHILISQGNLAEAEIYLRRCTEYESQEQSHKCDLLLINNLIKDFDDMNKYKTQKNFKSAEPLAANLVQKLTLHSPTKIVYVECLLNNCKIKEANDYLKNKISDDEKRMEEFMYLKCLCNYYDGKYEKSRHLLNQIVSKFKDNQRYEKLYENLKYIETEKEKANTYFKKGDYDNAILLYNKLLELDTNNKNFNSIILANRALCNQKKNRLTEALHDINKSIAENEFYPKAYYRRASINIVFKNNDKAKEDLNKVLKLEPHNKDAYVLLDEIDKEEKKKSKKDLYKILDILPSSNETEIRKAFRKLASKWHPDKNLDSQEQKDLADKTFKDINEAYSILSDARKKQIYDAGGDPYDNSYNSNTTFEDIMKSYGDKTNFQK